MMQAHTPNMNEIEVSKQHMEALRALADVTLKISEAKNNLTKLEETETEYLISREKRAIDRIKITLDLSHNLVEETNKNYESINDFARIVRQGANFLSEAQEDLQDLIKKKDEHYTLWERDIKNQEETITSLMKGLKIKESEVESGKLQIEIAKKKIQDDIKKINDERGILDRAIERLKQGRI